MPTLMTTKQFQGSAKKDEFKEPPARIAGGFILWIHKIDFMISYSDEHALHIKTFLV